MRKDSRKEIRRRRQFAKAANAITFAANAKPFKPLPPKPAKSDAERLNEDIAILKGLARSFLKLKFTTLKEEGRIIRLTGPASTGLAVVACASLLEMDSAGTGKITLINEAEGDFSMASGIAITDTIKALRSPVEIVLTKPIAIGSNKQKTNPVKAKPMIHS